MTVRSLENLFLQDPALSPLLVSHSLPLLQTEMKPVFQAATRVGWSPCSSSDGSVSLMQLKGRPWSFCLPPQALRCLPLLCADSAGTLPFFWNVAGLFFSSDLWPRAVPKIGRLAPCYKLPLMSWLGAIKMLASTPIILSWFFTSFSLILTIKALAAAIHPNHPLPSISCQLGSLCICVLPLLNPLISLIV